MAVASVLKPDRPASELSPAEIEETGKVFYVRAALAGWPGAHLRTLLERPAGYFSGLLLALTSSHWNLRNVLRHAGCFGEAVVVGQWMKRSGYAVLHTHYASTTAMLVEKVFGIHLSMTLHGSAEFIDPIGFCMREKVSAASLVIAISNFGASQVMRFCEAEDWTKVAVVRLGVDSVELAPHANEIEGPAFQLVCVATLVPVKGHALILRAVATLVSEGARMNLVLVGDGPERARLERLTTELGLQDCVQFTGSLPNEQARKYVAAADAFILASFAEGIPVVLMEAMALGIPCLSTWVTGIPELIENGTEGLLFAPADTDAIARCVRRLFDDPALRVRLGKAGRRKVAAEYDQRQNVAMLASELRKLG